MRRHPLDGITWDDLRKESEKAYKAELRKEARQLAAETRREELRVEARLKLFQSLKVGQEIAIVAYHGYTPEIAKVTRVAKAGVTVLINKRKVRVNLNDHYPELIKVTPELRDNDLRRRLFAAMDLYSRSGFGYGEDCYGIPSPFDTATTKQLQQVAKILGVRVK